MEEKELESLVTQQVRSALGSNQKLGPYNVLGILTHMGQGLEDLFEALIRLAQKNMNILIWTKKEVNEALELTSRASSIPTMDIIVNSTGDFCLSFYNDLESIMYGAFSFEIANKVTLLEDSNSTVNLLLQGLLSKIPVYIVTPFPPTDLTFDYGPSGMLTNELSKRLSFLIEMGFRLVNVEDLADQFVKHTPAVPNLITEDYLEGLKGKKHEIFVPHSTIITPLAQERANTLDIKIIKI
ncbi:hypothetical protein CEE45_05305 [Candidatus Heimdallarchaeota archaeon B3_Heim]|nr:MAG: hypothetical protein CEE45_05305 [Candidatus Heimdallarchaeota archaeon B3_Heim]